MTSLPARRPTADGYETRPSVAANGVEQTAFRLPLWDDLHTHPRKDLRCLATVPHHGPYFGRILAMPNTRPEVETGAQAAAYRAEIVAALGEYAGRCTPLTTIMLTDDTGPDTIRDAARLGVTAAKLYPQGATTNSGKGVTNLFSARMLANYAAMVEVGMVLCGHFEEPHGEILTREEEFIPRLDALVRDFPDLRVVAEHVTTAALASWVLRQRGPVAGSITPQHLVCTLNDVLGAQGLADYNLAGGGPRLADAVTAPALRPHNYCLPVAKTMRDRRMLIALATSGHAKFFFGTDTAPHDPADKECADGCAGVFVPGKVALAVTAWVFEACGGAGWRRRLEEFTSVNGARFYRLPRNTGTVTFRRQPWTVPARVAGHVPFAAGRTLPWEPFPDAPA